MDINYKLAKSSIILKEYVNKYAYIGLSIAIGSIFIASLIVSYQITGFINLEGFIKAQTTNPAIWMLDLTPFSLPIGDNHFVMDSLIQQNHLLRIKPRSCDIKVVISNQN